MTTVLIILAAFSLILLSHYLITTKFYNYYIETKKPDYKLLFKLFDYKLVSQERLFFIDYNRRENGYSSIFNNEDGPIIECENNCHNKNEVQLNYLKDTK